MKSMKRTIGLLLAAALLFGMLPAVNAAETKNTSPAGTALRPAVLLGTDGLANGDLLVLGSACAGGVNHPVQWVMLNPGTDNTGTREAGAFLASRYLLPAGEALRSGGVSLPGGIGDSIPSAAVLGTTLCDSAFIANTGDNYRDGCYDPDEVPNEALSIAAGALTDARFFELSAREAEQFFGNTDALPEDGEDTLLRRPYAWSPLVSAGDARTWQLRSKTVSGDPAVMAAAADSEERIAEAGGLIRAKEEGETVFSRPAFNLAKSSVAFVYQVPLNETYSTLSGTASGTDTPSGFGEAQTSCEKVADGNGIVWRAALRTLPQISASSTFNSDGTVTLNVTGDGGRRIGFLAQNADGEVTYWGTARAAGSAPVVFDMTRTGNAVKVSFFAFEYNSGTNQLYTSNLISVRPGTTTGFSLGVSGLKGGDRVFFNDNPAYVANAAASSGVLDGGSTTTLTESDEYPVRPEDAVFLLIQASGDGYFAGFVSHGFDISGAESELCAASPHRNWYDENEPGGWEGYVASVQSWLNGYISRDCDLAAQTIEYLHCEPDALYENVFGATVGDSPVLNSALACTWVSDNEVSVPVNAGANAVSDAKLHSVQGEQLFLPSAAEYLRLPWSVRNGLGRTLLRSSVTENFDFLSVASPCSFGDDLYIGTLDLPMEENAIVRTAAGFNLRKDKVAFLIQSGLRSNLPADGILEPETATPCDWDIALFDENATVSVISSTSFRSYPVLTCNYSDAWFEYLSGIDSYVSAVITDSAGNVKYYSRKPVGMYSTSGSLTLDVSLMEKGDRAYVFSEYEASGFSDPVIYAGPMNLVYEKKLGGSISIVPDPGRAGNTFSVNLDNLELPEGETLDYLWYDNRELSGFPIGTDPTLTLDRQTDSIRVYVRLSSDPEQVIFADAEILQPVLPVLPGNTDRDLLSGGTLYFGGSGSREMSWKILGASAAGMTLNRYAGSDGYSASDREDGLYVMKESVLPDAVSYADSADSLDFGWYPDVFEDTEHNILLDRTSIHDPAGVIDGQQTAAWSGSVPYVFFSASAADYEKMPASLRFAGTDGGASSVNYWLRTQTARGYNWYVDSGLEGQSISARAAASSDESYYLRPCTNLDAGKVVLYVPADCDLTGGALNAYGDSRGLWKLIALDRERFLDDVGETPFISSTSVGTGGRIAVTYNLRENEEPYALTAWAEKDGNVVWLDSKTDLTLGVHAAYFDIPVGIDYERVCLIRRTDRGRFKTDFCGAPYVLNQTALSVITYTDGVRSEAGGTVSVTDSGGSGISVCASGDAVTVNAVPNPGFRLEKITFADVLNVSRGETAESELTFIADGNTDYGICVFFVPEKPIIRSAYLHINENINLTFTADIPVSLTNPRMVYSYRGSLYTVTEFTVNEQGRYCFEFTHITPDCLGEQISAVVYADYNGRTLSHSVEDYSVKQYCANMLARTEDSLLISLLSDALIYGEKAQFYTGHDTDNPVTAGLTLSPGVYPEPEGLKATVEGEKDSGLSWHSASLELGSAVAMCLRFYARSTEGVAVDVKMNGRTETFTSFTPVPGAAGIYEIRITDICAAEFGATAAASFRRNGEPVGQTAKYCVNAYVCAKQNSADGNLSSLVKALYNYGVSALIYYNERILKK